MPCPREEAGRYRSVRGKGLLVLLACAWMMSAHANAQSQGQPGKFDFYVMNLAAPADFCHVPGTGAACVPPRSFVLHGLWTQNNDGSYPVNCSAERGPARLERYLVLTPDLPLLQHEWDKHGTCTAVGGERFFAMERKAYKALRLPEELRTPGREKTLATADVVRDLESINPKFPKGSILLSCKQNVLTAIEACFRKDLKPVRCQGLHGCSAAAVTLASGATTQR